MIGDRLFSKNSKSNLGRIIYDDSTVKTKRRPNDKLLYLLSGSFFLIVGVSLLVYLVLGLPVRHGEDLRYRVLYLTLDSFVVGYGVFHLLSFLSIGFLKVHANGIILPIRTLKQTIKGEKNFLPFSEIRKIEVRKDFNLVRTWTKDGARDIDGKYIGDLDLVTSKLEDLENDKFEVVVRG
jgi:hypothetical protein